MNTTPDGNGIEIYTESSEDGTMGFANGTWVVHDRDGRERSGRDRRPTIMGRDHGDRSGRMSVLPLSTGS